MYRCVAIIVLLILAAATPQCAGENKIEWTTGFPQTGSADKSISVKGTFTLDAGYSVKTLTAKVWRDGDIVISFDLMVGMGTFGPATLATLPTSGDNYNVVVFAEIVKKGEDPKVLGTVPKVAKSRQEQIGVTYAPFLETALRDDLGGGLGRRRDHRRSSRHARRGRPARPRSRRTHPKLQQPKAARARLAPFRRCKPRTTSRDRR